MRASASRIFSGFNAHVDEYAQALDDKYRSAHGALTKEAFYGILRRAQQNEVAVKISGKKKVSAQELPRVVGAHEQGQPRLWEALDLIDLDLASTEEHRQVWFISEEGMPSSKFSSSSSSGSASSSGVSCDEPDDNDLCLDYDAQLSCATPSTAAGSSFDKSTSGQASPCVGSDAMKQSKIMCHERKCKISL
eukprot:TRINITY_DN39083_c0_g1_i1.p1 TRINITY_DN39083_c0_g1~~TRINITY_DN39083_c0_g1_i1.p1  ORF type:complete len:192 (-),score=24.70 TRINITY_DN39083_c0_g1_i1:171-746(-)